ncbi:MAG TPA: hypothetical protein DDW80_07395, partial [Desulfovibrio sp.]|nr:hypothetical protein [Desulfovibrio sp.]
LGADLDLAAAPADPDLDDLGMLYAESASRLLVGVPEDKAQAFEALFAGQDLGLLGRVSGSGRLSLSRNGARLLDLTVDDLAQAFKTTLAW